ncbi:MAG: T9SS type A sorting domain-containing protein, partial [Euryarchaeota archaeon]|nr:T9SS type A sorting domain-containing protein [Euryarchaeota archaeon]
NAVEVQEWLRKLDGDVRVFPTVTDGSVPLQVQWLNGNNAGQSWSIFDAAGKQVSSGMWSLGQNEIPVSGLASGMHILRFNDTIATAKFWVR